MKPSVRQIIWTDWPALAAAWGIPLSLIASLGVPYVYAFRGSRPYEPLPLFVPIAAMTLLAGILLWRIDRIRYFFHQGQATKGIITGIWIVRDRGRLEYAYEFNGRRWDAWSYVHKNSAVLSLAENQIVDVLVDRLRPSHAIVRDLYANRQGARLP